MVYGHVMNFIHSTFVPDFEQDRITALDALAIMDTAPERDFDDLTRLAATVLGVKSAAVSLIGRDRQWFKSRHGVEFTETRRDVAFCDHAVASRSSLIVLDTHLDGRFMTNPLVTSDEGIRFYAGIPLFVDAGHCVGTLCVFDPAPRTGFTTAHFDALQHLARLATDLIISRQTRRMGKIAANVVEATSDAIIAASDEGKIIFWNAAAAVMFGYPRDEAIGRDISIIMPDHLASAHHLGFANAARGGETHLVGTTVELTARRVDGTEFPIDLSLARWGEAEKESGFAAIIRDTSARKSLELQKEQSKILLDAVVANLPTMLFVKDCETRRYLMINKAGETMMRRDAATVIGASDEELLPLFASGINDRDTLAMESSSPRLDEGEFIRPTGEKIILRTTRVAIGGSGSTPKYLVGISEDVTQARAKEAEIYRLAHYDALTGLHNRVSWTDHLASLVGNETPFAMLSISLNRFKSVNDQYGHSAGDEVLVQVAGRLNDVTRADTWLSRVSGDEFVVILTGDELELRSKNVAQKMLESIGAPFSTGRIIAHIGASIGIVLFPQDGSDVRKLRENADLALQRAKHDPARRLCFFDQKMDTEAAGVRLLERDLRRAVDREAIHLDYQPVISTATGRVTSVEALARWTHPDRGPVRPDIFIALAEKCGLIDRLGEQLLVRACEEAASWPQDVRLAVNLSPLQFESGSLLHVIRSALSRTNFPASRLQLEVTEGLVLRDVDQTFKQLDDIRNLGIQILMDDFGVGYSSLSYFERFRFDKVKIDKSFVASMTTSVASQAIVQAVIGLGTKLGMGIVAEGVETVSQARMLIDCGCTHLQGYLFSKPTSPDMVTNSFNQRLI